VDPPGAAEPTEDQRRVVDRLCERIVHRRLTHPALLYLEVARPLNYIGAQAMHFFQPIVSAIFDVEDYERFAKFLENRGAVDYLIAQLEHFEEEYEGRRRKRGVSRRSPESPEHAPREDGRQKREEEDD
jgi:hypothetical protein